MIIETKKQLKIAIMIDLMMNRGVFRLPFRQKLINILLPDYIMCFLITMRKKQYYKNQCSIWAKLCYIYYCLINRKLSMKLGFSIASEVFGYGLVIPHHGTIVVGGGNVIGNFAVLHTSTCITQGTKSIGDGLYLSTGSIIVKNITLGSNISIGANSLVNSNFTQSNLLIAGTPAKIIKESLPWYVRDGEKFLERINQCTKLIAEYNINR